VGVLVAIVACPVVLRVPMPAGIFPAGPAALKNRVVTSYAIFVVL
jgi:hypothetical protein